MGNLILRIKRKCIRFSGATSVTVARPSDNFGKKYLFYSSGARQDFGLSPNKFQNTVIAQGDVETTVTK